MWVKQALGVEEPDLQIRVFGDSRPQCVGHRAGSYIDKIEIARVFPQNLGQSNAGHRDYRRTKSRRRLHSLGPLRHMLQPSTPPSAPNTT